MLKTGDYNDLVFEKFVEFGAYLSDGIDRRNTILLPRKYVPENAQTGDSIRVFIYLDSEDRPVATTRTPKAKAGDLAMLRVVEQTPVGAFLDWGLEKDLFVPFREQPDRMLPGKYYLVRLYVDPVTGRIVASRRLSHFYDGDVKELKKNQAVRLIVYGQNSVGYRIIINEKYTGIVYANECPRTLSVGEKMDGFIHCIRPQENRADVRLRRDGFLGVLPFKETVLDMLKDSDGFLPLDCDSSPEKIKEYFVMSKRTFKQVVGQLYKEQKITLADGGIRLNPEPPQEKS